MCGIVGAVGVSSDPAISYHLFSNLMRETKVRGRDATGHFLVDLESNTELFKLPVPSDTYIKIDPWKRVINGSKAIIGHCRWTTHGTAKDNKNNHPFVTKNGNLGLIHNGKLDDYDKHKHLFNLETDCDSEILLHTIILEKNIVAGIREIYKTYGPGGDFAVMIAYRNPKNAKTKFFTFREPGRPTVYYDCTEQLGQYVFCSTEAIWKAAVAEAKLHDLLKDVKPVDVPNYEIWEIDAETMEINKHEVEKVSKRSTTTVYSGGYYNGSNYGTGYRSTSNHSTHGTSITKTSPISLASDPNLLKKLGPGWSKDTNSSGQLVLTFDDSEIKTDDNENEMVTIDKRKDELMNDHELLVHEAAKDPSLRWMGWEEEANRLGIDVPEMEEIDLPNLDTTMDQKVMDAYIEDQMAKMD